MDRFVRTKKYNEKWIKENSMGPNPLWLLEDLCSKLKLDEGMRILDMGCGKALTSIFLAKEYSVNVWANDLWISPTDNLKRIKEAGVEELVYPIKAEAHALPYAEEFFDAIVSVDSYHYFGTDEIYFPWYYHKLAKKGSQIAIVVPGLTREFENKLPDGIQAVWEPEMYTWHSADWWKYHWEKTGLVDIEFAGFIPDGKKLWIASDCDQELLKRDYEDYLTFVLLVARKK
jgi:cyclopropane fatty-acyl-phospholipid synthase-like methyltransferase